MSHPFSRRDLIKAAAATPLILGALPAHSRPARSFAEYRSYDAIGLAKLVRNGEASALDLLETAIARAEQVDPTINAIVVEHFERAREQIRKGLPDGALRGVPFLLKDLAIALRGTVTTSGSRFFKDAVYDYDSTLVERYQDAGLVIFGKTHSPEFGSSTSTETTLHGATRNPWDLGRGAGGSSGGAAAAVIAGIVPAAHASDGGGSIRIPAASCGLFGIKPNRGRLPDGPGVYEAWAGMSTDHVVSRSVRDSALLMDLTQGPVLGDAYSSPPRERPFIEEVSRAPGKLRIALMKTPLLPVPVAAECTAAVESAAKLCESLGHTVIEASPKLDAMALWDAFGSIVNVGVAQTVTQREDQLGRKFAKDDIETINRINVEAGRKVSGLKYSLSRDITHRATRTLAAFQKDYDVILSPTMASLPPEIGVLSLEQPFDEFILAAGAMSCFTSLFNITGQPAMSVPLHWTDAGLPVGVMFAGRFGDEATLFRLAGQLEQAAPWFNRLPSL